MPVYYLNKAERDFRVDSSEHWQVEFFKLEPRIAAVLVLDFNNDASSFFPLQEHSVRLAPTLPTLIPELNPRSLEKVQFRSTERKKGEVFMHLSLVTHSDCESSNCFSPSYKRWLLV